MTRDLQPKASQGLGACWFGQHAPREPLVSVLGLQVCAVMSSILFSCVCWGLRLGPYVCKVNTVPIKPLLQPRYYFFNKCAWLKITLQIIKHSIDSQGQALEIVRRTPKDGEENWELEASLGCFAKIHPKTTVKAPNKQPKEQKLQSVK